MVPGCMQPEGDYQMFNYRWPLFLFLLGALALGACQPVMPPTEAPVEESARTVAGNLTSHSRSGGYSDGSVST